MEIIKEVSNSLNAMPETYQPVGFIQKYEDTEKYPLFGLYTESKHMIETALFKSEFKEGFYLRLKTEICSSAVFTTMTKVKIIDHYLEYGCEKYLVYFFNHIMVDNDSIRRENNLPVYSDKMRIGGIDSDGYFKYFDIYLILNHIELPFLKFKLF